MGVVDVQIDRRADGLGRVSNGVEGWSFSIVGRERLRIIEDRRVARSEEAALLLNPTSPLQDCKPAIAAKPASTGSAAESALFSRLLPKGNRPVDRRVLLEFDGKPSDEEPK
jgi:hypothetical protein